MGIFKTPQPLFEKKNKKQRKKFKKPLFLPRSKKFKETQKKSIIIWINAPCQP